MTKISLILPVRNEEKTITNFINRILEDMRNLNLELIVVCNGCKDKTYERCQVFRNKIKLISLKYSGKGRAIIKGLENCTGNIIGFTDGDGSYSTETIKKIINEIIKNNYDVLIGSRWKNKNFFQVKESFKRKIFSRLWFFFVKLFLGLKIKDTQAGIKFFSKYAIDSINKNFISKGYEFDVELLLKLKNKGFKINEIAVEPTKYSSGALNLKNTISMFKNLIEIWYYYKIKGVKS